MNTMYAAVGSRAREIGTLRVLGFRPRSVYVAFLLESLVVAAMGGVLDACWPCHCTASQPARSTGPPSPSRFRMPHHRGNCCWAECSSR